MHDLVAVLDIGKTHAKLSVVDPADGAVLVAHQHANRPRQAAGMAQLDLAATEAWLLATLRQLPCRGRVGALVPVAHGAAAVLLDAAGLVLAAPDYEDRCFDAVAAAYGRERDTYASTCSPRLPAGLNLGVQLFYIETQRQELWSQMRQMLLLPQYWAWHLCGVAATEISSLGAHTDLWQPAARNWSDLARRRGWSERFAPLRPAGDVLGRVSPEVVAATGMAADCAVLCGLHDSNASWLAQRRTAGSSAGLTVLSSGTWSILMQDGVDLARLDEGRDMLANVDVFGAPLATARFMGGREYAAVAGAPAVTPTRDDLDAVMAAGAMALPTFAAGSGPFRGRAGLVEGDQALDSGARAALASLYVTLVVEAMLELLGGTGTVVIDGPIAANPLIPGLLQALCHPRRVLISAPSAGVVAGALCLVLDAAAHGPKPMTAAMPIAPPGLAAYRDRWRERVRIGR